MQPIIWQKPVTGTYKINVEGSYRNNGSAGIGGIVRDSDGNFISAFSWSVQSTSSTYTEALAAKFGSILCTDNGLTNFTLEMDSLVVANILINKNTTNMKLKKIIYDINVINERASVNISHCFREANLIADFLANMTSTSGRKTFYASFQQLSKEVKGFIQLDKWQLPPMRKRYDKSNFFVS